MLTNLFLFTGKEMYKMASFEGLQQQLQTDIQNEIAIYMAASELNNMTPSRATALAYAEKMALYEEYHNSSIHELTAQERNEMYSRLSNYAQTTMQNAYTVSIVKNNRVINNKEPINSSKWDFNKNLVEKNLVDGVPQKSQTDGKTPSTPTNTTDIDTVENSVEVAANQEIANFIQECKNSGCYPTDMQLNSQINLMIEKISSEYLGGRQLSLEESAYIQNKLTIFKAARLKTAKSSLSGHATNGKLPIAMTETGSSGVVKKVKQYVSDVSEWARTEISYSGSDMIVTAETATTNGTRIEIAMGAIQTLSYSIFTHQSPVNVIGNVNAKDYVMGPRTIAGSMVFAVFNQHWGKKMLEEFARIEGYPSNTKILMDEIPPIDLTVSMGNEMGSQSRLAIYGIRFYNEGMVMSVNDVYTENTYQFVAVNVDYLEKITDINLGSANAIGETVASSTTIPIKPANDGGQKQEIDTGMLPAQTITSVDYSKDYARYADLKGCIGYYNKEREVLRKQAKDQLTSGTITSSAQYYEILGSIDNSYQDKKQKAQVYYQKKKSEGALA